MRPVSTEIAVREGYDAIFCPVGHLYLSAADGNALKGEAYFRRVLDAPVPKKILGVEACLWSERVSEPDSLLWRILPRLSAVAQLQWSAPADRDYTSFLLRVKRMKELYTAHGWAWNPAAE